MKLTLATLFVATCLCSKAQTPVMVKWEIQFKKDTLGIERRHSYAINSDTLASYTDEAYFYAEEYNRLTKRYLSLAASKIDPASVKDSQTQWLTYQRTMTSLIMSTCGAGCESRRSMLAADFAKKRAIEVYQLFALALAY